MSVSKERTHLVDSPSREPVEVESYAGYRYPQEPRRFRYRGHWYAVAEMVRTWREPDELHFHLRVEEGDLFELVYKEGTDEWFGLRISRNRGEKS